MRKEKIGAGAPPSTSEKPRSLREKMAERPEAFAFAPLPGEANGRAGYRPVPLKAMVGGFEYAGRDEVSGLEFWGRKPKLRQLAELFDLIEATTEGEGAAGARSLLNRMAEIAARLLYTQTEKAWRSATVEEISDAFDLNELVKIKDRWFETKAATEGEVLAANPITG